MGDDYMKAVDLARWFLYKRPELAFWQNRKLNKLLYFADIMHLASLQTPFMDEPVFAFHFGPVYKPLYLAYQNGEVNIPLKKELARLSREEESIVDTVILVYGDLSDEELEERTKSHGIYKQIAHLISLEKEQEKGKEKEKDKDKDQDEDNPQLALEKLDEKTLSIHKRMYLDYIDFDFDNLGRLQLNGNTFYFLKDQFPLTSEILQELNTWKPYPEPRFLDLIDGLIVVS